MKILPTKPRGRSYQMIFNEGKDKVDDSSDTFLVNQILPNSLLVKEQITPLLHMNLVENLVYRRIY